MCFVAAQHTTIRIPGPVKIRCILTKRLGAASPNLRSSCIDECGFYEYFSRPNGPSVPGIQLVVPIAVSPMGLLLRDMEEQPSLLPSDWLRLQFF